MHATPDRPLPDGLVIRPWRDEADWQTAADITNASREADGRDTVAGAASTAGPWLAAEGFDAATQVRFAELDGRPVGWASGIVDRPESDDLRILFNQCRVHPAHRRRGIGTALLAGAEADALAHADRMYPGEARRRVHEAWLRVAEREARALLEAHGYSPARYGHYMDRDLTDPIPMVPPPAGIEIRPVPPERAFAVLKGFDEASRDTWEYGGLDDASLRTYLDDPLSGQVDRWVVAWDGDKPVAGVLGWVDEAENETLGLRRGYLERIWTLREYRGRGIASALVAHTLEAYRAAGLAVGHLSVDADNPSHAGTMYERMGFRITDGLVMLRRPAD